MKWQGLLLSSAAAIAAIDAAQAADLALYEAEPVNYMRVCDAFGSGYYYIPGTDTCLSIGGALQFETRFFGEAEPVAEDGDHYTNWRYHAEAKLEIEARTETDWWPLISYIELETEFPSDSSGDAPWKAPEAWILFGPLLVGHAQSFFDVGGGFTLGGADDGVGDGTGFTDNKLNQILLIWEFDGLGVVFGAEDNVTRAMDWIDCTSCAGDIPDLVGGLTYEWESGKGQIAFLYADWGDPSPNTMWGVQGGFEVEEIFETDMLKLAATYIESGGNVWGVLGSYQHSWAENLTSAITVRYDDTTGSNGVYDGPIGCDCKNVEILIDTKYWPADDFLIAGEVGWFKNDPTMVDGPRDVLAGRIRFERFFNSDL